MRCIIELLKNITPPVFLKIYRLIFPAKYGWRGKYKKWQDVEKISSGYDSELILNKVYSALLKVKNGEAIYERDGVIFNRRDYNWPLLSGLMYFSVKNKGCLSIVDFGGSLGSTYYQNKKFIKNLKFLEWSIIEQKHFVDVGIKSFQDDVLKFYYTLEGCLKDRIPNVLIISSVLQYMESPFDVLDEILDKYNFENIIIDRTPFVKKGESVIKCQKVNPRIYEASYPCWFFNLEEFVNFFEKKGYLIYETFDALDGDGPDFKFYGFIITRKIFTSSLKTCTGPKL